MNIFSQVIPPYSLLYVKVNSVCSCVAIPFAPHYSNLTAITVERMETVDEMPLFGPRSGTALMPYTHIYGMDAAPGDS